MFAGGFEPKGWTLCDGKLLTITQHFALYSIIGTAFGGDGIATFAVPDMRGVIPSGEISSRPFLGNIAFRNFSDNTNPNLAQPIMTINFCICMEGELPVADQS